MSVPVALSVACLVSVALLLLADRRGSGAGRVVAKLGASTCFVLVAVALGALTSTYGKLILGALVLGWLGDALLLSRAPKAFMGGLASFLVGALLFTASDLSVARDRFVQEGFFNRLWGWPTYFVAQLVLAWTVATAAAAG